MTHQSRSPNRRNLLPLALRECIIQLNLHPKSATKLIAYLRPTYFGLFLSHLFSPFHDDRSRFILTQSTIAIVVPPASETSALVTRSSLCCFPCGQLSLCGLPSTPLNAFEPTPNHTAYTCDSAQDTKYYVTPHGLLSLSLLYI